MAKIISLINLKGGVGKTTTTVQLAECLAYMFQKRVLVIDLDPQTNATIALIGEDNWLDLQSNKRTVFHLFDDKINNTNNFSILTAIKKRVSNLSLSRLDLLASSIDLIHIQDQMREIPNRSNVLASDVLKAEIEKIESKYDYILVDCPPSLGLVTENGLRISDYYLIPTIPDKLSTWGIPQIIQQIGKLSKNKNMKIKCLGLLFTKVQIGKNVHDATMDELKISFPQRFVEYRLTERPNVFDTFIPQSNQSASAMDYLTPTTGFKGKYGYGELWQYVHKTTKEVIENAI